MKNFHSNNSTSLTQLYLRSSLNHLSSEDISEAEVGAFDMTLVGIKALKEEDMSVDQMAVELKKKLRSK